MLIIGETVKRDIWNAGLFCQYFYKSKTVLKIKSINLKKEKDWKS